MKIQYDAAKAEVQVNESMSSIGNKLGDVGEMLPRAQDKTRQMQAHAEADESLEESGVISEPGDTRSKTDRDLDALRAQSGVDAELAKLKGKINPKK